MNRKERRIHKRQIDLYLDMMLTVIREHGDDADDDDVQRALRIALAEDKVNAAFRAAGLPEAHGEKLHLISMGWFEEPSPEKTEEMFRFLAPFVEEVMEELAEEQDTEPKPRAQ